MIVVIDTNIWVMAISPRSRYHLIYEQFVAGNFSIVLSNAIVFEYREILIKKDSAETSDAFFSLIGWLPNVYQVEPPYSLKLIPSDPDDDKFVDAVVRELADFIVTEDAHFQVLKNIAFPLVAVKGIDEFLELIH